VFTDDTGNSPIVSLVAHSAFVYLERISQLLGEMLSSRRDEQVHMSSAYER
jgi:hypothetical protein